MDELVAFREGYREYRRTAPELKSAVDARFAYECISNNIIIFIYYALQGIQDRFDHIVGVDQNALALVIIRYADNQFDRRERLRNPGVLGGRSDGLAPGAELGVIPGLVRRGRARHYELEQHQFVRDPCLESMIIVTPGNRTPAGEGVPRA
jgi:hypothetical protein